MCDSCSHEAFRRSKAKADRALSCPGAGGHSLGGGVAPHKSATHAVAWRFRSSSHTPILFYEPPCIPYPNPYIQTARRPCQTGLCTVYTYLRPIPYHFPTDMCQVFCTLIGVLTPPTAAAALFTLIVHTLAVQCTRLHFSRHPISVRTYKRHFIPFRTSHINPDTSCKRRHMIAQPSTVQNSHTTCSGSSEIPRCVARCFSSCITDEHLTSPGLHRCTP